MTQPPPIPFPEFRSSAEGQPDPAGKPAAPAPTMPAKPLKRVRRLPFSVPGTRRDWPPGVD